MNDPEQPWEDISLDPTKSEPQPPQLRCYKCNKITDTVIGITTTDPHNNIYGFQVLYYCKTCFKNFLNT